MRKIRSHEQIHWRHIPTRENPADLGSRAGEVNGDKLWWSEPEWLADKELWPPHITTRASKESDEEMKIVRDLFSSTVEVADDCFDDLLSKFSVTKSIRVCVGIEVPV